MRAVSVYKFVAISHLFTSALHAQPAETPNAFDLSKLDGICGDVYSRTIDPSDSKYFTYNYERKIYEAARVNFEADSAETARSKIQTLWNEHRYNFQCNVMNFRVPRGNILKYAVEVRAYGLIDNAAKEWRLNLNIIDDSDKSSLLDFIALRFNQSRGTLNAETLLMYYSLLRSRGARHCHEIREPQYCSSGPDNPDEKAIRQSIGAAK